MIKFGYIVADRKFNEIKDYVEFVNDLSKADSTKPILVVGYNKAKTTFGNSFNILKKKIANNLFWTFKKTEKRTEFEEDIDNFNKYIINNIINNIKYYYINIYKLKYNKIKKIINIIYSKEEKYIYIYNGMLYFTHEDYVLGLSLSILEYTGINIDKLINKIKQNTSNHMVDDKSETMNMLRSELKNKEYAIPYLELISE